jgi:alkaline phosphatase D
MLVWDDHEVENDYAGLQGNRLQSWFPSQRASAYQAYWEHLPLPKTMRPRLDVPGAESRIYGAHDWGRLARILLLDDRQWRDPQVCPQPGHGGSNTLAVKDCPAFTDPRRTLLGETQERWLAGAWSAERPWNLLAQQTLMARFAWSDPAGADGGQYWTDGWDGYAPARQRLLNDLAARKLGGAVVLGGDVHSHYVADLKADFSDPRSATLATEFCGTSITSTGLEQARIDAARGFNPHLRYARSDKRGYASFSLSAKSLEARVMAVDDALDASSPVRVAARFHVEAGRPGAQPG